jgi:hypothetical protein
MTFRSALAMLSFTLFVSGLSAQEGPNRPEAKPVTLYSKTAAILVLDRNARCDDPTSLPKITGPLGDFRKARGRCPHDLYGLGYGQRQTYR